MLVMSKETIRTLPFEGSRIHELVFCGNGKDSEVILGIDGFPPISIPLSAARMDLTLAAELTVETSAFGDPAVKIRVIFLAEQPIVLSRAKVDYPGTEEDWSKELEGYRRGNCHAVGGWCVSNLLLTLSPAT